MARMPITSAFLLAAALISSAPVVRAAEPLASTQERLQLLKDEIAAFGVKLQTLLTEYDRPEVVGRARPFSERLTDAEILFLLGDYERASLVLYDLVNEPRHQSHRLYLQAVYYLAESLFQIGHDVSAKRFFQDIVERRDTAHLKTAVRRLIEIADRNEQWEGLEEHVAVLRSRGRLPAGIAYIRAKSFLSEGKPNEAIEVLGDVPDDHPLEAKARYVEAVANVQAGALERAQQLFSSLVEVGDRFEHAEKIRELAAMNEGRILLELGRYAEAMDAYQNIPRNSPLFEEALYEMTWTYVRAADEAQEELRKKSEYKRAQNALEILLLSEGQNPIVPEARLLLGSIHLRLEQFENATEVFDEVVERYGPVRDELDLLEEQHIEPVAYFEEISNKEGRGTGLLPPLALQWASGEEQLRRSLGVLDALGESEGSLDHTKELINKLLAALTSERRVSFFPALEGAQKLILEYGNTLTSLSRQILDLERQLVKSELDPMLQADLERVLAERAELEPAYRKLPQRKEDYEGRVARMRERMLKLQQQAYRLQYDIESMRAQLNGLRIWINQNQGLLEPDARKDYVARIERHELEVAELDKLHSALEQQIDREKDMISVTSQQESREDELRARYAATLEREREILDRVSGGYPLQRDLNTQQQVLAGYRAELERFEESLNHAVRERANDLKAIVLKEQSALEQYRDTVHDIRGDAQQFVGSVAQDSLERVKDKFKNLVLRADVGIVDVAWALKEEKTEAITKRVAQQRRELQLLERDFSEVLAED